MRYDEPLRALRATNAVSSGDFGLRLRHACSKAPTARMDALRGKECNLDAR